jgi:hypothetical protein
VSEKRVHFAELSGTDEPLVASHRARAWLKRAGEGQG